MRKPVKPPAWWIIGLGVLAANSRGSLGKLALKPFFVGDCPPPCFELGDAQAPHQRTAAQMSAVHIGFNAVALTDDVRDQP